MKRCIAPRGAVHTVHTAAQIISVLFLFFFGEEKQRNLLSGGSCAAYIYINGESGKRGKEKCGTLLNCIVVVVAGASW